MLTAIYRMFRNDTDKLRQRVLRMALVIALINWPRVSGSHPLYTLLFRQPPKTKSNGERVRRPRWPRGWATSVTVGLTFGGAPSCCNYKSRGATVAKRLYGSPPTKANRVQSPAEPLPNLHIVGVVPDDAAGRRVFSGFSLFPGLAFQHCSTTLVVVEVPRELFAERKRFRQEFRPSEQAEEATKEDMKKGRKGRTPPRREGGCALSAGVVLRADAGEAVSSGTIPTFAEIRGIPRQEQNPARLGERRTLLQLHHIRPCKGRVWTARRLSRETICCM
ncbi:hypothetical protein PR048_024508 [Dryococelus australis]|uniref:Uncharacterized protein n=1 Tax=Dryococelus australis TaxID=614101 RepID=A0ABQ9GNR0_9NEOP|nr:hypothetical protein PR048_024508 [Dryococelus australis]